MPNIRQWPWELFCFITAYQPFYNLLLVFYTMMDMFWLGWDGTDPADFSGILNYYADLLILDNLHGSGAFGGMDDNDVFDDWDGFEDTDGFDEFNGFDLDYH